MKLLPRFVSTALRLTALLTVTATSCLAAATLTQQIDPPEANVGDEVVVTLTVQNGNVGSIHLPHVDGLQVLGTSTATNITLNNGAFSSALSESFHLVPTRAGDITIPAFDIHTQDGQSLHVQAMKLHVLAGGNAPSTNAPAPANLPAVPSFNSNGPVVMPPANGAAPDAGGNSLDTNTNVSVPIDSDGRPAKVFMVITPKTTDAYVGEAIPMSIDFYIRLDVDAQQDSLPTIKGSDFLMNNLSVRPREDELVLLNEAYHREDWITAISAPKSGDFPLQMERETYWLKSSLNRNIDPFTAFFSHPSLAHESIGSNQLTIHVHDLPTEGRPANFTGAIGQLKVTGSAQPDSVTVGEPVTLRFTVMGEGNFDYVRCPVLAADPAWKTYIPSSKITYQDDSHTQGVKNFEQAVIPQKGGTLPLPAASFSYFDPAAKRYVTVPVDLPAITVTGSVAASTAAPPGANADSASAATVPPALAFIPNRVEIGSLHTSLAPAYRQPWFWVVQGGSIVLLSLGAIFLFLRTRSRPDDGRAERILRQRSLRQEEDALGEAARRGDARAFFLAARHAVQLQLGAEWRLSPEAITLGEIRQRDPRLAETLEPLFTQADEVIYSGHASPELDLAPWERHVRELLQPQTA